MRKNFLLSLVLLGMVQGYAQLLPYNDSLQVKKRSIEQKEKLDLWISPNIEVLPPKDIRKSYLIQTGLCAVGLFFNKSSETQLDCRMPKQTTSEKVEQHLLRER